MPRRAARSSAHLPGMEPASPVVEAVCAVVEDRFAPAAPSDRASGPLGFHDCVNVALGLDAGWPVVAYWEHASIYECHARIKAALASHVGPVDAWVSSPKRSRSEVIDALRSAGPVLTDLTAPPAVTRRAYVTKTPVTRRFLPDVAIAGVALWWSRNPGLDLGEVLTKLRIEPTHSPWQVLSAVDRRIRRTRLNDRFESVAGELLGRTRRLVNAGELPSPAPLLWRVATSDG